MNRLKTEQIDSSEYACAARAAADKLDQCCREVRRLLSGFSYDSSETCDPEDMESNCKFMWASLDDMELSIRHINATMKSGELLLDEIEYELYEHRLMSALPN